MANFEKCLVELRNLGYKARIVEPKEEFPFNLTMARTLVVRWQDCLIDFSELVGITIHPFLADAIPYVFGEKPPYFSISYPFDKQSFFFELPDDIFVECVRRHVQEASEVVAALPQRLKPR